MRPALSRRLRRRLPVLLQVDRSECALACLAMIAAYHGLDAELAQLRERFPPSARGQTLGRVIAAAEALQLAARAVRAELAELAHLQTPAILHWNMNHYVVLVRADARGVTIHDPATGRRRCSWAEASRAFTGVALELQPIAEFTRAVERAPAPGAPPRAAGPAVPQFNWRRLIWQIDGLGRLSMQLLLLAVVLEGVALCTPALMRLIIDRLDSTATNDLLMLFIVASALLLLSETLCSALRLQLIARVRAKVALLWTGHIFAHLLRLPLSYFDARSMGDVISRFNAIGAIQQLLGGSVVEAALDGLLAVSTILLMAWVAPPIAAVTLVAALAYGLVRMAMYPWVRNKAAAQLQAAAKQQSRLIESIKSAQTIKLNNAAPVIRSRFATVVAESGHLAVEMQRLNLVTGSTMKLAAGLQYIAAAAIGVYALRHAQLSVGLLFALTAYGRQFVARLANFVDCLLQMRMIGLQGARLADIVMAAPERHLHSAAAVAAADTGLSVDALSFRHTAGDAWVLRRCSFVLRPGESIALMGPSGAGKTTLAKVLLGVLEASSGTIALGGVELAVWGKTRWREVVAGVLQDDVLMSGTVADNIALFSPDATRDAIRAAATIAGIDAEIDALPMGYSTLIGDINSQLSAGQRQRLLLARAVYRQPKIIVLDESFCHVELSAEREIVSRLQRAGFSLLLITHRPETAALTTRALCLREGVLRDATALEGSEPFTAERRHPTEASAPSAFSSISETRIPSDEGRTAGRAAAG